MGGKKRGRREDSAIAILISSASKKEVRGFFLEEKEGEGKRGGKTQRLGREKGGGVGFPVRKCRGRERE